MPCDQQRIIGVDVKRMNTKTLEAALKSLDGVSNVYLTEGGLYWSDVRYGYVSYANGRIFSDSGSMELVSKVVSAYAKQCVADAAAQYGWILNEEADGSLSAVRSAY